MNNNFVKLYSFFKEGSEREIKKLSLIYDNHSCLKETISALIYSELSASSVNEKRVLLKPNWVNHSTISTDDICLRTNDSFLLASLETILDLKPKSVVIGDSPIQGARWDGIVSKKLENEINRISKVYNIPISILDFRRRIFYPQKNKQLFEQKPLSDYLIFDVGEKSWLEPITKQSNNEFRVTNYNPERLSTAHQKGTHQYCIAKELFTTDLIISIPKVKTHQKTGITGALKNIVGFYGEKDSLPHHRKGGTAKGGDCYPGNNILRYLSEKIVDKANSKQRKISYRIWQKASGLLWGLSLPSNVHSLAAGWFGNDTTWRMVLDLNTIVRFGKADGTISTEPQRILYSLCDGIIGGQGDGPLRPDPLPLGIISFTNNSAENDLAFCKLFRFESNKLPLLINSKNSWSTNTCLITMNGEEISIEDLEQYSLYTIPPPGWVDYLTGKNN